MLTYLSVIFSSLKAKVYAGLTLLAISFYAYMKWLKASNESKTQKLKKLKQEAKVAKQISNLEKTVDSFEGYQEAIDSVINTPYKQEPIKKQNEDSVILKV